MASNLKVDIVRPTATNGSLSLKGDSGGSATTNGVTVNSSGNTSITGTTTVSSLVATTADITGGTIDGTDITGGTIDGTDITVGSGKTLDVSAGTLTLANDQISGDKIDGGSASLDSLDVIPPASDAVLTVGSSSVNGNHRVNVTGGGANFFGYYLSGKPTLIKNTNDQTILIVGSDGTDTTVQTQKFYTNGTERMRIDSSGNVRAAKFTDIAGTGAPVFPNGLTGEIISEPTSSAATSDLIGWMTSGTSSESVQDYSTPKAVGGSSVILPKGVFLVTAVAAMIRAAGTSIVTEFSLDFLSSAPSSLLSNSTNVTFTENGYAQATTDLNGSRSHFSKIIEEYTGGTTYSFYAQINVTPSHAVKVKWKIFKLR